MITNQVPAKKGYFETGGRVSAVSEDGSHGVGVE